MDAMTKIKETTISARIIHPDGTIEDLGVIASTKSGNVFTKVFRKLVRRLGGKKHG